MVPGVAMVKNARRRFTCENASKRVHFSRSRCCFAHAIDPKIVQNRRKFSIKRRKQMRCPVSQWSKTHAVERTAKIIKARSCLLFPVLLCSRNVCENRSKSSTIIGGGISCVYGRARREAGQFEVCLLQTKMIIPKFRMHH